MNVSIHETDAREQIVELAASLHRRGLSPGTSGNLSVRVEDGWLTTPTGSSLGDLDPARLSRLDRTGRHVGGDRPTKETPLHLAFYRRRPHAGAVVHLHARHSAAVSCLADLDPESCIPPLTAYFAMKVGTVPLVPYHRPGDPALAEAVERRAARHHALLLANHGPVVAGEDLTAAAAAVEELEETAALFLLLRGAPTSPLTAAQVDELTAPKTKALTQKENP